MVSASYDRGAFLPEHGLWLDPHVPRDFAFISHAHSDHTESHRETILTEATATLMRARMGTHDGLLRELPFDTPTQFRNFGITLFPAGHMLGSAQCLIESGAGTLLYTGDFKLRGGLTPERAATPRAETLIMESTYGRPQYVFPPASEVIAKVVKFCVEAIEDGCIPVLIGYSLGKAQEILASLAGTGLPIVLHASVAAMTRIYESLGVRFPPYSEYRAGGAVGRVLIAPPGVIGSKLLASLPSRRIAALTGWALDPNARFRMRVDAAFPLSDHAGYDDLLRCVEQVAPRRVFTLHGFATEFASDLRSRGIEAWALTGNNQLELPVSLPASHAFHRAPASSPVSGEFGFDKFCGVCDRIATATGKLEKIRTLREYLASLDNEDLPTAAVWLSGTPFPLSDGLPMQIGIAVIERALLGASGVPLAEYRLIARHHNDAGLTAAEVMADQAAAAPLRITELQNWFERLRSARGPLRKANVLEQLLRLTGSTQAKYIVKILTGDLRIGLKEGLLEDAIAAAFDADPAAVRDANMLCGNIGETAVLARAHRLDTAELVPFRPIKCMLASPEPDAVSLWTRMAGNPAFGGAVWIEDKLDGIRAQVHVCDGLVEVYSRDLKRITKAFPEIAAAALRSGRSFVLDGELIAFQDGRPLSFFELQKRLGRLERDLFIQDEIPVRFAAFDALWIEGESLFREPLSVRRARLEGLALERPLLVAEVTHVSSAPEIESAFDAARARGNEGLMAKDPGSPYTPGRRGLSWIKLKKEFATLDVVVVAAEFGHGRRSKVLSDYTFAVRDNLGGLVTIGKAYSGLTDSEIAGLTEEFQRTIIRQDGRVFLVEPHVVLEVAFDSVQQSDRHGSGLALRFPRIKAIRRDKTIAEIDTVESAQKLLRRT